LHTRHCTLPQFCERLMIKSPTIIFSHTYQYTKINTISEYYYETVNM